MAIRCLVVDDHTLFRAGLRRLLEGEEDLAVVGEAAGAAEALQKACELQPDLVLMDIGMPGMSSFEAARLMKEQCPRTRLIFLTMYEDREYLTRCVKVGADAYLLKDVPPHQLVQVVREVHRGRKYLSPELLVNLEEGRRPRYRAGMKPGLALTPRERQIMKMIAEGLSVRQAAGRLGLSVKTVEAHKFNLMRKLDLHNRAQLVTYAIQKKIVKMPAEI
jgi:DNA-binding NarL/FixJ family response regulator